MGWSAYGLFRAHRYHLELNWTELKPLWALFSPDNGWVLTVKGLSSRDKMWTAAHRKPAQVCQDLNLTPAQNQLSWPEFSATQMSQKFQHKYTHTIHVVNFFLFLFCQHILITVWNKTTEMNDGIHNHTVKQHQLKKKSRTECPIILWNNNNFKKAGRNVWFFCETITI